MRVRVVNTMADYDFVGFQSVTLKYYDLDNNNIVSKKPTGPYIPMKLYQFEQERVIMIQN